MKFDLHVHTNYSDGKFMPSRIIDLAIEKNLSGIAITDHDTVRGVQEALDYSNKYSDFEVIPGIELGCIFEDEEVHILGYFINHNYNELLEATEMLRINRVKRGLKIIEKLNRLNINVNVQEVQDLSKEDFIGRVHIARALINRKYVSTISEAFEKYLNIDGPAYVERKMLSVKDSIGLVKKAGGVPILAHPGILKEKEKIIRYCIESGIEGIECVQSKHSSRDAISLAEIAKQNNLLITGGSDCHGEIVGSGLLLGNYYTNECGLLEIKELI